MCLVYVCHAKFFKRFRLKKEYFALMCSAPRLCQVVGGGGGWGEGGDVALNSLLMASLSLKLPWS